MIDFEKLNFEIDLENCAFYYRFKISIHTPESYRNNNLKIYFSKLLFFSENILHCVEFRKSDLEEYPEIIHAYKNSYVLPSRLNLFDLRI